MSQGERTTSKSEESGEVPAAWVRLLRVHATLTREMDARLRAAHGLTLRDYEVLLFLSWAPERSLRPVDLAEHVLLTQSGVTRLLAGLVDSGLVERVTSQNDRRVLRARLTDAGLEQLRHAAATHLRDVRTLFEDQLSERELAALARVLHRLPGGDVVADRRHPIP